MSDTPLLKPGHPLIDAAPALAEWIDVFLQMAKVHREVLDDKALRLTDECRKQMDELYFRVEKWRRGDGEASTAG